MGRGTSSRRAAGLLVLAALGMGAAPPRDPGPAPPLPAIAAGRRDEAPVRPG